MLLRGGDLGDALSPGLSHESLLLSAASSSEVGLMMPPRDKRDTFAALSAEELELLKQWIDAGAAWPKDVKLKKRRILIRSEMWYSSDCPSS